MKTKSLFFAALVLMSSVVALAAGKDEPRRTGMAVVPVKGSEVFKVIYKGETAGKVKLNIYNAEDKVIMAEVFNGVDGFICPLNFAGLQHGEYTIELIDAAGKKVEKIVHGTKKATKFVHVSKLINQEGKYLLSVVGTAGNEPINVKIFDAKNNLIHSETKEANGDFAQVYKLNSVSTAYTFEVSDNSGNLRTIRF
jgi:hypothetical protein